MEIYNGRMGLVLCHFGLLDRYGKRLTEPRFVRLQQVGPNAIWAAAVVRDTLQYGLLDTLGRDVLPFAAAPLSLPDEAGLLRRRSTPPIQLESGWSGEPIYPAGTTTRYYRLDGQPAFAGTFSQARAFHDGKACVKVETNYGIIDLNGRWITPPSPEVVPTSRPTWWRDDESSKRDPLSLFD